MLKLAFRGVTRYKKRTIITAFAIGIAIVFSIFMKSLLTGVALDSDKNLIWNDTSSAKIYAPGYFEERDYYPIDVLITEEQGSALEQKLEENGFTNYTKEFVESAQIMFYEDPFPTSGSITAVLKAMDSSNTSAYKFGDAQIEGDWISNNVDGVVLGSKLSQDMNAEVGYYVTIQTKGKGGFIQAFDIPIIGIISTGDPVVDASTIFFDYNTINDYLELDGYSTNYSVSYSMNIAKVKSISDSETADLNTLIEPLELEAYSWREIANDILQLQSSKGGFSNIFLFFTFFIAIVGISNTMLMAISERKNEIAMLKTLGYNNKYIKRLFTLEGTIIGFLGVFCGTIVGVLISLYYQIEGIDLSSFVGDTESIGYRINSVMHAFVSPTQVILIIILGLFVSMVAAYFAVRRTGRGEIAEMFRRI
jgi:ABC-type lipoprotein release transport system permease subunit